MRLQCIKCCVCAFNFLVLFAVSTLVVYFAFNSFTAEKPTLAQDGYWGEGSAVNHRDNEKIYKFSVNVSDSVLADLRSRLERTKYMKPIEDSRFNYGFNGDTLRKVVDYWLNKYDWKTQEKVLNQYQHFKTEIEGIGIHFMLARKEHPSNVKVFPLMIVHGWPGSFVEFTKILPLLTSAKNGIAFEVICPSIPGYGFSDAAHKPGLNALETSRLFVKLMRRLGYEKFYLQGGDWGAFVVSGITQFYPQHVIGMHLNLPLMSRWNFRNLLTMLFPKFTADSDKPPQTKAYGRSLTETLSFLLRESGYFHIQATFPDTVGATVTDSPAGLAAYIGEKFSLKGQDLPDGGYFSDKMRIELDHILTNIMVYWITGTSGTAMRLYKENIAVMDTLAWPLPAEVPVGLITFPNEIMGVPRWAARSRYPNITTFAYAQRGGHFAAMEEPEALAEDIRHFVEEVHRKYPETEVPAPQKLFQHDKRGSHDEL